MMLRGFVHKHISFPQRALRLASRLHALNPPQADEIQPPQAEEAQPEHFEGDEGEGDESEGDSSESSLLDTCEVNPMFLFEHARWQLSDVLDNGSGYDGSEAEEAEVPCIRSRSLASAPY